MLIEIILILIIIAETIGFFVYYRKTTSENMTEEEMISLVNEGQESGVLLASEATMIQNVFEFDEKAVKDIMVHRKNITALDASITLREAIRIINDEHFSRYPVYQEDIDHIIGIFHIKDALSLTENADLLGKTLEELQGFLSPVEFVPETHGINKLFAKMQNTKNHMILVVDEYGQLSGLLSMEDIIEEIVGSILDEHDEEEDTVEQLTEHLYLCDGSTPLSEIEDVLGVKLSEEFETLNGYLTARHGRVPEDGSSFVIEDNNITFTVKNVTDRVIAEVEIMYTQE